MFKNLWLCFYKNVPTPPKKNDQICIIEFAAQQYFKLIYRLTGQTAMTQFPVEFVDFH